MPTLYSLPPSPPCRAVLLTARAIGLDLDTKTCNIMEGDARKPDFIEMNPAHTIPLLDDEGYHLSESRAIMCYLLDKFGSEDEPLYPKDPQIRGKILSRLMFDQGTLYQRYADYYFPVLFRGESDYDEKKRENLLEAFEILDKFLEGNEWVAADNMTIADIALAVTVSMAEIMELPGWDNFSNVTRWFESAKSSIEGYDEINAEGAKVFKSMVDSMMAARA